MSSAAMELRAVVRRGGDRGRRHLLLRERMAMRQRGAGHAEHGQHWRDQRSLPVLRLLVTDLAPGERQMCGTNSGGSEPWATGPEGPVGK
ncbi:MAG TPA: hypothetical protein VF618_15970 [Thermoanaerobaculia bacterium]